MNDGQHITIAVKCAPEKDILDNIQKAGLTAVELYTDQHCLDNIGRVKEICGRFPFRYAVHAPNYGCDMEPLAELVDYLNAEVVVFHNIYWEDEWPEIIRSFKGLKTKLCLENTYSSLEPLKFMRRFNMGFCLDLEHVQIECGGTFEEAFTPVVQRAAHIHMTGYRCGSELWHTPVHHSPEHCGRLLDILRGAGYSGLVVSEARASFQTLNEFEKLGRFIQRWNEGFYSHKNRSMERAF